MHALFLEKDGSTTYLQNTVTDLECRELPNKRFTNQMIQLLLRPVK